MQKAVESCIILYPLSQEVAGIFRVYYAELVCIELVQLEVDHFIPCFRSIVSL